MVAFFCTYSVLTKKVQDRVITWVRFRGRFRVSIVITITSAQYVHVEQDCKINCYPNNNTI